MLWLWLCSPGMLLRCAELRTRTYREEGVWCMDETSMHLIMTIGSQKLGGGCMCQHQSLDKVLPALLAVQ